jgi:hypothetical protein
VAHQVLEHDGQVVPADVGQLHRPPGGPGARRRRGRFGSGGRTHGHSSYGIRTNRPWEEAGEADVRGATS